MYQDEEQEAYSDNELTPPQKLLRQSSRDYFNLKAKFQDQLEKLEKEVQSLRKNLKRKENKIQTLEKPQDETLDLNVAVALKDIGNLTDKTVFINSSDILYSNNN